MKLKELTFLEQFLYEPPKEKYWRGISVYLDKEKICSIDYNQDRHPITTEEKNDKDFWLIKERETLTITFNGLIPYFLNNEPIKSQRRFLLEDKDLAKKEVYKILEEYVKFFTK